jgi:hypothetical protein
VVHIITGELPKFELSVHIIHAINHQSTHKLHIATALILQYVLVYHHIIIRESVHIIINF